MLGFFKRRRNETLKQQAMQLGEGLMEGVNSRIEQWRHERLEPRREMMAAMFDERIVSLVPEEGLALESLLEIEALALLKNWHEAKAEYAKEGALYLTDEDVQFLDLIGGGDRFAQVLMEKIDEVGLALAEHAEQTINEEVQRRAQN